MKDIIKEPIINIDGYDEKNPFVIIDYVEDMYAYYEEMGKR